MFEHKGTPLISRKQFYQRVVRFFFYSTGLLLLSLGIGIVGYRSYAQMDWIDAFYNAAMILTGMGPVDEMQNNAAKIFSGCYALFSGIAFLSIAAVLFAPIAHRLLHLMHLDEGEDTE